MEKVIIHAFPHNFDLAARAARKVLSPDYEWPTDGFTVLQYLGGPKDDPVACFVVKRNKTSVTIWEQQP